MAFHPTELLAARRDYRVDAIPFDEANGGFGAAVVSRFTTSDALLEPIVLSGELVFSLRGDEMDVTDGVACGDPGRVIGKARVLYADVQLPVPSGGQRVYHGALHFTDHTPARLRATDPAEVEEADDGLHGFHSLNYLHVEPGKALTVSQMVFEEGYAYAGCFTFAVWDPAGHVAQSSACLPVLTPDELYALSGSGVSVELSADDQVAADQVDAAIANAGRANRGPVWSCALGASAPSSPPAWLALLPAMLLGRRLSRDRLALTIADRRRRYRI